METFFRNFRYNEVELSPDGSCLAALAPNKQRVGLVVVNLNQRKANWAYADRGLDIQWFKWANTNRLIFGFSKDGYRTGGLMAVDRDGQRPTALVRFGDVRTWFLTTLPDCPNEILVESVAYSFDDPHAGRRFPNVARMNLFTGAMTREVTNPGRVFAWWSDWRGVVRVGAALEDTRIRILHRANTNAIWETLADFRFDQDGIEPLGFDHDNRALFVAHAGDQPTEAVYTYDVDKKQIKDLAFRHAEVDVARPVFSWTKRALVGVVYHTDRPEVYWLDADLKKMQAAVDRALPVTLNSIVSTSRDWTKSVVLAASDRTPGTFYVLDMVTLKMEELFTLADWIHSDEMAEMKPIQYTARDGLLIHGYLTLPRGRAGKNLPLIVNPHGGPVLRDTWRFDPEVQFLANRGYAVLRMNFRGSAGYGKDFVKAGYKQWGLKQQDDITDGVRWAIAQGIADPKRICIYGASYGGYAALMGLIRTPELYRCAICYAGVTDITRYSSYGVRDIAIAKWHAAQMVGDPKKEKERLRETSPLTHVDRIQAMKATAFIKRKTGSNSGKRWMNS